VGDFMRKDLLNKILVMGIIVIFVGIGVQPAFANIIENSPPGATTIDGPYVGTIWQTCWYTFNSSDPDGDDVRFYIDWGDCTYFVTDFVPSGTEKTETHTWEDFGTFIIKAFAIDTKGNIGPESEYPVTIPRDKQEDCDCQEIDNEKLDKLREDFYRFDINANKLPLSFRDNPKFKELSNKISLFAETTDDNELYCWFLLFKGFYHMFWIEFWWEWAEEFYDRGQLFLSEICDLLADRAEEKLRQNAELAHSIDCFWTDI
jgi:hypothetical protein